MHRKKANVDLDQILTKFDQFNVFTALIKVNKNKKI